MSNMHPFNQKVVFKSFIVEAFSKKGNIKCREVFLIFAEDEITACAIARNIAYEEWDNYMLPPDEVKAYPVIEFAHMEKQAFSLGYEYTERWNGTISRVSY